MTNLDLHNKVLQLARELHELEKQHPELHTDLIRLESILEGSSGVESSHLPIPSLYRNNG